MLKIASLNLGGLSSVLLVISVTLAMGPSEAFLAVTRLLHLRFSHIRVTSMERIRTIRGHAATFCQDYSAAQ